jgi:hypothetical protein
MAVTISGSGQIVKQIQQTVVTTGSFSSTSTSMVDITGMSVNITPSNVANKVLITVSIVYSQQSNYNVAFQLLRNGTPVGIGTSGTTGPNYSFISSPAGTNTPNTVNWTYLDSPSSTSALTYKIQCRQQLGSAGTFALNFANGYLNATSDIYGGCYTSSITAQEIAYA